jgi:hypothetical protein
MFKEAGNNFNRVSIYVFEAFYIYLLLFSSKGNLEAKKKHGADEKKLKVLPVLISFHLV